MGITNLQTPLTHGILPGPPKSVEDKATKQQTKLNV